MKIRSITYFCDPKYPLDEGVIAGAGLRRSTPQRRKQPPENGSFRPYQQQFCRCISEAKGGREGSNSAREKISLVVLNGAPGKEANDVERCQFDHIG